MKRVFAAGLILALIGGVGAGAQPRAGGASATLYELPGFQGRQVTITGPTADLGDWRFNDRAKSARFRGRWRVCEHDGYRGRCQDIGGEVADLTTYGLFGQISSLEPAFGGSGPTGGWDRPGRESRGVEGARTVFFVRPTVDGLDLAAGDTGADRFCRRQGLGRAVWFDSSERAREALGPDGQIVGRTTVIRDLLCRRY